MIRKSCQHCENIKIRTKFVFTMEMAPKIKWKQNEEEKKTKCKDYKERWSHKSKKVRLVWQKTKKKPKDIHATSA